MHMCLYFASHYGGKDAIELAITANMRAAKFSTRAQMILGLRGHRNIADLARDLGYERYEKLARLIRYPDAQPSADMLADFANTFANLNLQWLLTGVGHPLTDQGDRLYLKSEVKDGSFPTIESPDISSGGIPKGIPKGMPRGMSSPSAPPGSVRFVLHSGEGGEGEDAYGLLLEGLRRHHQAEEARFAAMARQMDELRAEVMALRRQLDER